MGSMPPDDFEFHDPETNAPDSLETFGEDSGEAGLGHSLGTFDPLEETVPGFDSTSVTLSGFDSGNGSLWSCSGPIEDAVMADTPLASLGAADAEPMTWRAPTGELAQLQGIDSTGTGVTDLCALDANGDGVADTWLQDTTGEPSPASGEPFADTMYYDGTGEGLPNCVIRDQTGTGDYTDLLSLDDSGYGVTLNIQSDWGSPAPSPPLVEPGTSFYFLPEDAPMPADLPANTIVIRETQTGPADLLPTTTDPEAYDLLERIAELQRRSAEIWMR